MSTVLSTSAWGKKISLELVLAALPCVHPVLGKQASPNHVPRLVVLTWHLSLL